jgi:hypothetical protein
VEYGDERDPEDARLPGKNRAHEPRGQIKKPMLVVAGKERSARAGQRKRADRGALKKEGTPAWYLMATDEGHGYRKKVNQDFQFYTPRRVFESSIC